MIEVRECGCRTVFDGSDTVVSVGTCPSCLPVGAITWLIENGRQLELFDGRGVDVRERGRTELEQMSSTRTKTDTAQSERGLPF